MIRPGADATCFLNVDLELVSRHDIGPLLARWSRRTVPLRDSVDRRRRTVWLELARQPKDVDSAIRTFARLVEALPPRLRRSWNGCDDRCLNVGIQAAARPHAASFGISNRSIAALEAIAARLEFTVYAPDKR